MQTHPIRSASLAHSEVGTQRRVLLAEDDEAFRQLLQAYLKRQGYAVESVSNGAELMAALTELLIDGETRFDALVSDICMPTWSGVQVLNGLRCAGCTLPVILITACRDQEAALLATELGARLLLKPFELGELARALESLGNTSHGVGSPPI